MLVPKPFARVRIAYGAPFTVGPGAAARGEAEARVTAALEEVTRLSECPDAAATLTG
jgi:lysophospholipid acyltransferase (LPLAT)-like uncharacterized protein